MTREPPRTGSARQLDQSDGSRGDARARVAQAVVAAIRGRAGRGPERAKAAFLGERTLVVELGSLLTTFDRTLIEAGFAHVVESRWARLCSVIAEELGAVVGEAVPAQAACTSWVMDAGADMLLLVFSVGSATRHA